jgi:hypothetical protein
MNEEAGGANSRLDILISVGLGLAAVLTALCVYLTDVHDDEATLAFNAGVTATTEATGSYVEAAQRRAADEALFVEYAQLANAGAFGDRIALDSATYLQTGIMREDLREAVEWWGRETRRDPTLTTPFVPENPFYEQPELEEAEALTASAGEEFAKAEDEQAKGDTFIIADIIVAFSLFLFGVAGVASAYRIKLTTTVMAYVIFAASLIVVATG